MSTLLAPWQVSGVFQTYLVWDAILKENSWELWATILLGLAMTATRVVAGLIRKDVEDSRAVALRNVGWAVLVTQSLTMVRSIPCGVCWRLLTGRIRVRFRVARSRSSAMLCVFQALKCGCTMLPC